MECDINNQNEAGRVLRSIDHLLIRVNIQQAKKAGIDNCTAMHGWILGYLSRHKNEDVYQRDIEREFSVTRSAVTAVVKKMESCGYIERVEVKHDARLKKLVITDNGEEMYKKIIESFQKTDSIITEGVDKEELSKFFESIKSNGKGYALDPVQNSNPDTAYFNGMALRVLRSLEYAKSLPQWDHKTLVVNGGSQGGLQTSWAAALDPDVTLARPSISWGCDFGGGALLKRLRSTFPLEYVPALDYYDITFHARRTKCKVEVTRVGLGDYTCPPSGLAIYYNELATPDKSIVWYQGSTHGFVPKNAKKFTVSSK